MISTMWLAKDPNGKVYGYEHKPVRLFENQEWSVPYGVTMLYADVLEFLFGDAIKAIDVPEDTPVQINFGAVIGLKEAE